MIKNESKNKTNKKTSGKREEKLNRKIFYKPRRKIGKSFCFG